MEARMTTEPTVGRILSIALRSPDTGPMREVTRADAVAGGGLVGDVKSTEQRGITLLASGQWKRVIDELAADLPWHMRRANVLVECDALGHLIGRRIRVGPVEVEVIAETRPCALMDQQHAGLRAALVPDCRGGVYGRILTSGTIRVGDAVRVAPL